jgi:hypothetical protein
MTVQVDFEMSVDTKGYRLKRGHVVGEGGPKRHLRLKDFPTLYLEFAKVQTDEALLNFVNRFGRLTNDEVRFGSDGPVPVRHGDKVSHVLHRAEALSVALEMLRGKMADLPKWQGGQFEIEIPELGKGAKILGGLPLARLTAFLAPDPLSGVWQLKLEPPCLLDAVYLQFGQAAVSNADVKQCRHCSKWFEAGANSGRRRHAEFCSRKCKTDFHSLERSR